MDMRKHLPPNLWINLDELRRRGDKYDGVIVRVVDKKCQNRFAKAGEDKLQVQPVIQFIAGMELIPTITMRKQLMEALGDDTDLWIGQGLSLQRVCLSDERTGKEVWRRQLVIAEGEDLGAEPAWVRENSAPDTSDPIGDRDADGEQLLRFSGRRR